MNDLIKSFIKSEKVRVFDFVKKDIYYVYCYLCGPPPHYPITANRMYIEMQEIKTNEKTTKLKCPVCNKVFFFYTEGFPAHDLSVNLYECD